MLGYVEKYLQRFKEKLLSRPQQQAYHNMILVYGDKIQYTNP